MEPEEKKAIAMLQQIRALRKDQVSRRHDKQLERKGVYKKNQAKIDAAKAEARTAERREKARKQGLKEKADADAEGGRKRKKPRTE